VKSTKTILQESRKSPVVYGGAGAKQTKFSPAEIKFEAKTLKVEQQANTL
jgi:hypothetical protein